MSYLGELDDPNIPIFVVNVLRTEGGQEDELELAAHSGKIKDVGDGNLPVQGVHEHVELVQDAEGGTHGPPEGEDEGHAGVGLLSPGEAPDVPVNVQGRRVFICIRVDTDGEATVFVIKLQLPNVTPDRKLSGEVYIDALARGRSYFLETNVTGLQHL